MTRQFGERKTRSYDFKHANDMGGFHCTRDIHNLFSEPGTTERETSSQTVMMRNAA